MKLMIITPKPGLEVRKIEAHIKGFVDYELVGIRMGKPTETPITEDLFVELMSTLVLGVDSNEYPTFTDIVYEKGFIEAHGKVPSESDIEHMTYREIYQKYFKDHPHALRNAILYNRNRKVMCFGYNPELIDNVKYLDKRDRSKSRREKLMRGEW